MKGTIQDFVIREYKCSLYLPGEYGIQGMYFPVIYVNGEDNIKEIMNRIEPCFVSGCETFILVSIQPEDWNNEFTPWPAPALSKKGTPFTGGAPSYIDFITNIMKPFMDTHYRTKPEPENTALIGYSLGGLTALYGLYKSKAFGKIGSMSGSLWYDGWTEFMESNMPSNPNAKVYLSLGKSEEHSRSQRMARVGDCTRKAAGILKEQLLSSENLILEWNEGGHFNEIPQRFIRALLWLMQEKKIP